MEERLLAFTRVYVSFVGSHTYQVDVFPRFSGEERARWASLQVKEELLKGCLEGLGVNSINTYPPHRPGVAVAVPVAIDEIVRRVAAGGNGLTLVAAEVGGDEMRRRIDMWREQHLS
jgi:hypothetical protein